MAGILLLIKLVLRAFFGREVVQPARFNFLFVSALTYQVLGGAIAAKSKFRFSDVIISQAPDYIFYILFDRYLIKNTKLLIYLWIDTAVFFKVTNQFGLLCITRLCCFGDNLVNTC